MTQGNSNLIQTPCVNICVIDTETEQCIGCGRTRLEIAGWLRMSNEERQVLCNELPERVATLTSRKKRKGGAKARRKNTAPDIMNFGSPTQKGF